MKSLKLASLVALCLSLSPLSHAENAAPAAGASGGSGAAGANGPVAVGADAPDFTLPTGTGTEVTLSSYKGKKNVVLYFYPKDNTPGCTTEAESFRDSYESIKKLDTEVLGVSVDDATSHKFFANKHELAFPLLADVGGKVARQYGVMGWIMAKRVTFIIGKDGKVKQVFPDVDVTAHTREVIRALQAFAAEDGDAPAKPKGKAEGKRKGARKNS